MKNLLTLLIAVLILISCEQQKTTKLISKDVIAPTSISIDVIYDTYDETQLEILREGTSKYTVTETGIVFCYYRELVILDGFYSSKMRLNLDSLIDDRWYCYYTAIPGSTTLWFKSYLINSNSDTIYSEKLEHKQALKYYK